MRFKSQQHKSTFKKAIRKKDKTDTRLMAAMYLLKADQILWNKVKGNIRESRIDYDEVRLDTVSENCYTLYSASKDMYFNTDHVSLSDIFDTKLISEKMYNVIITAINIRRLGLEKAEAIEYGRVFHAFFQNRHLAGVLAAGEAPVPALAHALRVFYHTGIFQQAAGRCAVGEEFRAVFLGGNGKSDGVLRHKQYPWNHSI